MEPFHRFGGQSRYGLHLMPASSSCSTHRNEANRKRAVIGCRNSEILSILYALQAAVTHNIPSRVAMRKEQVRSSSAAGRSIGKAEGTLTCAIIGLANFDANTERRVDRSTSAFPTSHRPLSHTPTVRRALVVGQR